MRPCADPLWYALLPLIRLCTTSRLRVCVCVLGQGGFYVAITGTFFKDSGVVTATNGIDTVTCGTPAAGTAGNSSGMYWAPSGTSIQCLMPPGVGGGFVFSVSARGITSVAAGFTFSYFAPIVTAVVPVRVCVHVVWYV